MRPHHLLDTQFEQYTTLIDDCFKELHALTIDVGNQPLAATVNEIRSRLGEPFLFVIVGEVKVGKSSFINALLETNEEVCKVAPDPCTDIIQQIVYSDQPGELTINPYLKKIMLPISILRKIAIVDTPGTNTIVEHHTEITERFIPISDLVIFVFEAKNPYRQSAWDFFNFISVEWQKKVIFVLQQADVMEPADLETNRLGLIAQAEKRGVANPQVFCVSAKRELQGQHEASGFEPMRDFIRHTVTGGNNLRLKLQSHINNGNSVLRNLTDAIQLRQRQFDSDFAFRRRVNALLEGAGEKSARQIETLVAGLLKEYDTRTTAIKSECEAGLGVFTLLKKSFLSIFGSGSSLEEWAKGIAARVQNELKPALDEKLYAGVRNVGDGVKQMAEIIHAEIERHETILQANHQIFGDIANKRIEKLEQLQAGLRDLAKNCEAFVRQDLGQKSADLVPGLATGGGLAIVGGVLATVTTSVAVDITGGVLAAIGLGVAGRGKLGQRERRVK